MVDRVADVNEFRFESEWLCATRRDDGTRAPPTHGARDGRESTALSVDRHGVDPELGAGHGAATEAARQVDVAAAWVDRELSEYFLGRERTSGNALERTGCLTDRKSGHAARR